MIEGPLPGTAVQLFAIEPNNNSIANNVILKNSVYNFTIVVSNSVGNVSTKSTTFCELLFLSLLSNCYMHVYIAKHQVHNESS